MRYKFLYAALCFIYLAPSVYGKDCFLVKEKEKVIKAEGECSLAYAPQSTFKIALSLMGFDSGILQSPKTPSFPFKKEYLPGINVCKGDHNPQTWMRDSCVWFSQVLVEKIGAKKFRDYVRKFNYGNKDLSGENSPWLNSSLQITPDEQIKFIQSMIDKKLPVSDQAFEMTKEILFLQELPGGWNLYGKTGNGRHKGVFQQGWFVGWIEKSGRKLVFVNHIADDSKQSTYASFRSRNDALTKLWYLIDELEK